jgi:hypothetical protein
MAAGVIQAEIRDRNARVDALQNRWDRMRRLIDARAIEIEGHPRWRHRSAGQGLQGQRRQPGGL